MVNLNNLLLEMLKAYDKNQNKDLLSLINSVDNIFINEPQLFDNEIAKINHIQTIARQRNLSFEEKSFLFQLINSKDNSEESKIEKFCACSLLGEHDKAKEYFEELDSNDKESLRNYPIMKFYCPE